MAGEAELITEQVLEQVRQERDTLRTLLDSIADEVWTCDAEGNVAFANPAALQGLGFEHVEEIPPSLPELLSQLEVYTADGHPRDLEDSPLLRSLKGETFTNLEEMVRHPRTGELMYRCVSSAPIRADSGEITGAVAVVRDITARKQAEAALRELNKTLEARVQERTLALAEARNRVIRSQEGERLRVAQELHDGPVQTLHALSLRLAPFLESVADEVSEAQLVGVYALLHQANKELRSMMAGLRPAALKEFGLQGAIRSHVERLERTHPHPDIDLDLDEEEDLPEGTRLALFRICEQLLHNAVQHAAAEHVSVQLKVDAEQVMLEVHDDGRGFEVPDHLREFGQDGHWGLVGAAERAESIGGYLTIQSVPGDGTIVRVYVSRPLD